MAQLNCSGSSSPISSPSERGQASILLVIVVALGLAVALSLVARGREAIDHARAQNAADAVALAGTVSTDHADALALWYRSQGISVVHQDGLAGRSTSQANAADSPGAATAYAEATTTGSAVVAVPVFAAALARAEQLLSQQFEPIAMTTMSFDLGLSQANEFAVIAPEFGICDQGIVDFQRNVVRFGWC